MYRDKQTDNREKQRLTKEQTEKQSRGHMAKCSWSPTDEQTDGQINTQGT
jgi:hypothetical protein